MILKRIINDVLNYSKYISVFEHYVVIITGKRAIICDREFHPIHTVENLNYADKAYISPDEKNILIVSTSNHFCVVSLTDFKVKSVTIRSPYNGNLQGCACWSYDGRSVYVNAENPETTLSFLRRYDISDMSYKNLLPDIHFVQAAAPLRVAGKYYLVARDRENGEKNNDGCSLIVFDGESYEEYPFCGKNIGEEVLLSWEYEEKSGTFIIYTLCSTYHCDINGNIIETVPVPKEEKLTSSFSDVFKNVVPDKKGFKRLKALCELFGLDNMTTDDTINIIRNSADGKKIFVGTHYGLYVLDAETKEILYEEKISYGVQNIAEISADVIAAEKWHGVWLYEI